MVSPIGDTDEMPGTTRRFESDFPLVYRPNKRPKYDSGPTPPHLDETITDKRCKQAEERNAKLRGLAVLQKKSNRRWVPKPAKILKPQYLKAIPPLVCIALQHPLSNNPRALSPHQYSRDYFVDTHAIDANNSFARAQYLREQAAVLCKK